MYDVLSMASSCTFTPLRVSLGEPLAWSLRLNYRIKEGLYARVSHKEGIVCSSRAFQSIFTPPVINFEWSPSRAPSHPNYPAPTPALGHSYASCQRECVSFPMTENCITRERHMLYQFSFRYEACAYARELYIKWELYIPDDHIKWELYARGLYNEGTAYILPI